MSKKAYITPRASTHFGGDALTEGFEFRISGIFKPNLELMLDPGMAFYTERGSTTSRSTRDRFALGHGYFPTIAGSILGIANRVIGDGWSTVLMTKYTNNNDAPRSVTITSPREGNLVAINLDEVGGTVMCKRESFFGNPHHPDHNSWMPGSSIRAGWGVDLQLWNWRGLFGGLSLAIGEQTFLWQQIRAPKSREHFKYAVNSGPVLPELPGSKDEFESVEEGRLAAKNWVFLQTQGDVVVKDLTEDDPHLTIERGTLLAMAPHVRRGAWFTKSGLVSNAINLGAQNDGETLFSPTFDVRGNDILDIKGPCRLWIAEPTPQ